MVDIVVLGISTGGPQALRYLIPQMPADLPIPIVMVLHMPEGFTEIYASKLAEISPLRQIDPQARVVVATADIQTSTREITRQGGAMGFVNKPLVGEQVARGGGRFAGRTPMELTALQNDALTELINIAFSRTAASLSELTSNRVDLEVPEIQIEPIASLDRALARFVRGDVATVHQIFFGTVDGDALLVLNHDGAVRLVELLTGPDASQMRLGASGKEVLGEVGNILLNACLGVFGNLLQIRLGFTVPRLNIEDLGTFLRSIVIGKDELKYALVVGARFRIRGTEVNGCLVLVLGVASLNLLTAAIENWASAASGGAGPSTGGGEGPAR